MNSHQRRVNRRYWIYTHDMDDLTLEQYLELRKWCKLRFGKVGYRWGNGLWYDSFSFRKKEDYTLFLLTWT
jgi:hypothetical protein